MGFLCDIKTIKEANNEQEVNLALNEGYTLIKISCGPTGYFKYLLATFKKGSSPVDACYAPSLMDDGIDVYKEPR